MGRRKYDFDSSDYDSDEDRKKRTKRGDGTEAARVKKRLADFDSENSEAWKVISQMFGPGVTHSELKSIAQIICEHTTNPKIRLDRDASRDNRVLLKWFTENWSVIEPHLQNITLRDSEYKILSGKETN
ncbi:hypothetical protein TVAG_063350 [Trichomonas vaginalis G3]|uniref:Uncharacterized protein n=1 Tax=Trichomonas vaginalis (strain ATCC PRA-98 / G3) TaxID=412133 RepID=A2G5K5_TRIV3|nr:hypothetical protein TVAGG3_0921560 [Trichomonas vaginalis G3]EAX87566.1 hypothetical protein TVAG_063350 [Trichomonas vaginalis G3]KAI5485159.1 hypothetical protein TVAGG3_0921560 [Trichomonas vaginalis G3]|eukprot:XP_001300496.1 hypothetical protein [Trichomonas vaginalis G3]